MDSCGSEPLCLWVGRCFLYHMEGLTGEGRVHKCPEKAEGEKQREPVPHTRQLLQPKCTGMLPLDPCQPSPKWLSAL